MQVETKSASLDTLSVTIQALHVNGKQMTLAVFRQLPSIRAYNDDGSLLPMEYWGVVRYTIKDEGDVWVICASGGRLYRCPLRWHGDGRYRCEADLEHAKACVEWWHKVKLQRSEGHYGDYPPRGCEPWAEDSLPDLEQDVSDCAERLETCKRAEATREALARLTQLFIAV